MSLRHFGGGQAGDEPGGFGFAHPLALAFDLAPPFDLGDLPDTRPLRMGAECSGRQHRDGALLDAAVGLFFIVLPARKGEKPALRTPFGYRREGFSDCL
jgi:hypothetical protein